MGRKNTMKDSMDGVLVEAKQEYTKQLCNILNPIVYETIFDIYTNVVSNTDNMNNVLIEFQEALKQIPKWNADLINDQVNNILDKCSFFNDLLSVVFLSNVKILTAVRMNKNGKKKVKVTVPSNEKFVHDIFKNVANNIYNDPYLFSMKRYNGHVTNNIREVFDLIESTTIDTIRNALPFQNIIESYINQDDDEDVERDDYEEEVPSYTNDMTQEMEGHIDPPEHDKDDDVPVDNRPLDTEQEQPSNDTVMNNFFGAPEETKSIPIQQKQKPQNPQFFDDDDTPDPKT
tara:strand:- start:6171 stop:7034 length:864 start_codon:yes stop_codon:yes gene_type:complete